MSEIDLIKRFEALKKKQQELSNSVVSKKATYDTYKSQYTEKLTYIRDTYKVESIAQAQELLAKSTAELDVQLAELEQALSPLQETIDEL